MTKTHKGCAMALQSIFGGAFTSFAGAMAGRLMFHGKWPVSANEAPQKGAYAAHTLNCNTGSIGVSLAAAAAARERPLAAGDAAGTGSSLSPLTK